MFSCLPGAFRVSTRNDFVLKSFVNAVASSLLRERAALSQNPGTEFVERCCVRYCRQKVFKRIFVGDAKSIPYRRTIYSLFTKRVGNPGFCEPL
jgi:hypothetical protein